MRTWRGSDGTISRILLIAREGDHRLALFLLNASQSVQDRVLIGHHLQTARHQTRNAGGQKKRSCCTARMCGVVTS